MGRHWIFIENNEEMGNMVIDQEKKTVIPLDYQDIWKKGKYNFNY